MGQVTRLYNKVIAGPHTHTHTYSIHVFMRGLGILHNTLPVGKGALIELIIVLSVGYLLCVVLDRMMMVGPLQTAWRCGRRSAVTIIVVSVVVAASVASCCR